MKTIHLYPAIFALLTSALVTNAQIPEFTLIESGEIPLNDGYHISSAWFDMDNDGDMDVIITNSSSYNNYFNHANLLYSNDREGKFSRIQSNDYTYTIFGVGVPGPFGDIDNDGDADIIGTNWVDKPSRVFLNEHEGNFHVLQRIDQLDGIINLLYDINNDGCLDLVQFNETESRLYLNDSNGQFNNYANMNISYDDPNVVLHSVAMGDADNDGDFDLYAGYSTFLQSRQAKNEIYENMGNGTFENRGPDNLIVADTAFTPAVNWIDYDNDGDMDLYVLNSFGLTSSTSRSGKLFENKGDWEFEAHTIEPESYLNANRVSSIWGDLDNDADPDLYITVEFNSFSGHASAADHNLLLMNNGDGTFTEITEGTLAEESSHTATIEDIDNDGDLDVLLVRFSWANNGRNNICINEGNDNSWVSFDCEGTQSNRSAFGARVVASAMIYGERLRQTREITPMSGHVTYPSNRVHFGLGDAEIVDSLIIRWPSGHVDTILNIKARQFYRVIEDSTIQVNFPAYNYIRQTKSIPDVYIEDMEETVNIDLSEHFSFVPGDTVQPISGDTLSYTLLFGPDPDIAQLQLTDNLLSIEAVGNYGESEFRFMVSCGLSKKLCNVRVIVDPGAEHLVTLCTATASSQRSSANSAAMTIDGMPSTYWRSERLERSEWLIVELDTIHTLAEVIIDWDILYAEEYYLLTSIDNENWDTVYYQRFGNEYTDTVFFNPIEAAYIQISCIKQILPYGFSIAEVEVYSMDSATGECPGGPSLIRNHEQGIRLSIYPNPTHNIINLDFGDDTGCKKNIQVFDVYGNLVYSELINQSSSRIDLDGLANGIYFIRISNDNFLVTEKIIKMK
jgi:hypothetical protein